MKKSNNKKIGNVILMLTSMAVFMAFIIQTPQEVWEVPGKYKKMENPVADDSVSLSIGKTLYAKHCRSCHGREGLGDGPKAAELETYSGDFSSETFQSQSDGELFYKTTFGRDEMPAYEKRIASDEDRWMLVTYMRTFAEK